jgi:uncharacterized membrane protein
MALTLGYIDNRGMRLPALIGYGLAILAAGLLFGTPRDMHFLFWNITFKSDINMILTYFATMMICVSIGEIVVGKIVEKTCDFVWWDYTHMPLHITRYTSIPTTFCFALMIVIFMEYGFERLYRFFLSWHNIPLVVTSLSLIIIMSVDGIYHAKLMKRNKGVVERWRLNLKRKRHNKYTDDELSDIPEDTGVI